MKIGAGILAASSLLMSLLIPFCPLAESLGRYSWVEFVAEEPQPAKIMFSHWWGGLHRICMRKGRRPTSRAGVFRVRTFHGLHAGSGQDDHGPGPEHRRFSLGSPGSLGGVGPCSLELSLSLLPRHLHPHLDLHFRELPVRRELWLEAHGPLLH